METQDKEMGGKDILKIRKKSRNMEKRKKEDEMVCVVI